MNSKSLDSAGKQLLNIFGRAFFGAGLFLFGLGGIVTNYFVVIRYYRSGLHGSLVPLFGGASAAGGLALFPTLRLEQRAFSPC